MDVEQLKLILNAVQNVSGAAQAVAILWVLKGYFIALLGFGVLGYFLAKVVMIAKEVVLFHRKKAKLIEMVETVMGNHYWEASDVARVVRWAEIGKRSEPSHKGTT